MISDTVLISENFPDVFNSFSAMRNIDSKPLGAKVFYSKNTLDDDKEYYIGKTPLNNPDVIVTQFNGEFDLLIDDGPLPESIGSTIYKLEKSKLKVIRS